MASLYTVQVYLFIDLFNTVHYHPTIITNTKTLAQLLEVSSGIHYQLHHMDVIHNLINETKYSTNLQHHFLLRSCALKVHNHFNVDPMHKKNHEVPLSVLMTMQLLICNSLSILKLFSCRCNQEIHDPNHWNSIFYITNNGSLYMQHIYLQRKVTDEHTTGMLFNWTSRL